MLKIQNLYKSYGSFEAISELKHSMVLLVQMVLERQH